MYWFLVLNFLIRRIIRKIKVLILVFDFSLKFEHSIISTTFQIHHKRLQFFFLNTKNKIIIKCDFVWNLVNKKNIISIWKCRLTTSGSPFLTCKIGLYISRGSSISTIGRTQFLFSAQKLMKGFYTFLLYISRFRELGWLR